MNNLYAEKEEGWRTRALPGGAGCDPARVWGGAGLGQSHPPGPFQTRPDPGVSGPGPASPWLGEQLGAPGGGLSGPLPSLGPAALPRVVASPATSAWSRPAPGPPPLGFPGPPGPVRGAPGQPPASPASATDGAACRPPPPAGQKAPAPVPSGVPLPSAPVPPPPAPRTRPCPARKWVRTQPP